MAGAGKLSGGGSSRSALSALPGLCRFLRPSATSAESSYGVSWLVAIADAVGASPAAARTGQERPPSPISAARPAMSANPELPDLARHMPASIARRVAFADRTAGRIPACRALRLGQDHANRCTLGLPELDSVKFALADTEHHRAGRRITPIAPPALMLTFQTVRIDDRLDLRDNLASAAGPSNFDRDLVDEFLCDQALPIGRRRATPRPPAPCELIVLQSANYEA